MASLFRRYGQFVVGLFAALIILIVPIHTLFSQANISALPGLDVMVLIDYTNYLESPIVTQSMFDTALAVGEYLTARNGHPQFPESNRFGVLRFNANVEMVVPFDELPLRDVGGIVAPNLLANALSLPQQAPSGYSNFEAAFLSVADAFGRAQSLETGRQRVILLLADDGFGATDLSELTSDLEPFRDQMVRIGRLFRGNLANTTIHVLGYGEQRRWQDFEYYWQNDNLLRVDTLQVVTPQSAGLDALTLFHTVLPTQNTVLDGNTLYIPPYVESVSFSHFRATPNDDLSFELLSSSETVAVIPTEVNTPFFQTMTLNDPLPGTYTIARRGNPSNDLSLGGTIEYNVQTVRGVQGIYHGETQVADVLVNQPFEVVWRPVTRAQNTLIYANDEYPLVVTATLMADSGNIDVLLTYRPEDGSYRAPFSKTSAEVVTLIVEATYLGRPITEATESTFNVLPIELVVEFPIVAEQYRPWFFTAHFSPSNQPEVVLSEFASPPMLQADLILANGEYLPLPLPETLNDDGRFIWSIDLLANQRVQLDVKSFIRAANGDLVEIFLGGKERYLPVDVVADEAEIAILPLNPRLFEPITVTFRPQTITALELSDSFGFTMFTRLQPVGRLYPMMLITPIDQPAYYAVTINENFIEAQQVTVIGRVTPENESIEVMEISASNVIEPIAFGLQIAVIVIIVGFILFIVRAVFRSRMMKNFFQKRNQARDLNRWNRGTIEFRKIFKRSGSIDSREIAFSADVLLDDRKAFLNTHIDDPQASMTRYVEMVIQNAIDDLGFDIIQLRAQVYNRLSFPHNGMRLEDANLAVLFTTEENNRERLMRALEMGPVFFAAEVNANPELQQSLLNMRKQLLEEQQRNANWQDTRWNKFLERVKDLQGVNIGIDSREVQDAIAQMLEFMARNQMNAGEDVLATKKTDEQRMLLAREEISSKNSSQETKEEKGSSSTPTQGIKPNKVPDDE